MNYNKHLMNFYNNKNPNKKKFNNFISYLILYIMILGRKMIMPKKILGRKNVIHNNIMGRKQHMMYPISTNNHNNHNSNKDNEVIPNLEKR